MSNYLKYIPKDLARELRGFGMPLELCDFFKCPIDYDTKDVPTLDYERYDRIIIPTYGEVIDWFSGNGIFITFDVFFTFILADRIGYLWRISFIDYSNGDVKLKTISEEKICNDREGCGGSFELDAQSAIRYAMNLKKNI